MPESPFAAPHSSPSASPKRTLFPMSPICRSAFPRSQLSGSDPPLHEKIVIPAQPPGRGVRCQSCPFEGLKRKKKKRAKMNVLGSDNWGKHKGRRMKRGWGFTCYVLRWNSSWWRFDFWKDGRRSEGRDNIQQRASLQ